MKGWTQHISDSKSVLEDDYYDGSSIQSYALPSSCYLQTLGFFTDNCDGEEDDGQDEEDADQGNADALPVLVIWLRRNKFL